MLLHIDTFATTLKDMAAVPIDESPIDESPIDDFIHEVKLWADTKPVFDFILPPNYIPVGDAVYKFIYSVICQLNVEKLDPVFVSTTYTVTLCNILMYFIIYGEASLDDRTYRYEMMIDIFDVVGSLPGTLPTFRSRLIKHVRAEALAQVEFPSFVVQSFETP